MYALPNLKLDWRTAIWISKADWSSTASGVYSHEAPAHSELFLPAFTLAVITETKNQHSDRSSIPLRPARASKYTTALSDLHPTACPKLHVKRPIGSTIPPPPVPADVCTRVLLRLPATESSGSSGTDSQANYQFCRNRHHNMFHQWPQAYPSRQSSVPHWANSMNHLARFCGQSIRIRGLASPSSQKPADVTEEMGKRVSSDSETGGGSGVSGTPRMAVGVVTDKVANPTLGGRVLFKRSPC